MRPISFSFVSHCAWLALLSAAALSRAQTADEAKVRLEPYVLNEVPLVADAGGTTELHLADSTPLSLRSLASLGDNIANLHINASGAGSFGALYSLRGLSNTPYFGDPSVAVYFDDIPLGGTFTYPVDLLGFSSALVARGPQPASAGRAAEGGLITFASPAFRETPAGTLRLGFGNYRSRYGAVEYQTAASSALAGSVSAGLSQRDGYVENTQLNTPVDDQQVASASARFRLRPTPTSEVSLQLLVNEHRDGAQPLVPLNGPAFSVARGREGSTDSTFTGGALKIAFATPIGRLSSTTSRTRWTLAPYDNRLVLPPTLDSHLEQTQSAWNEELRLGFDTVNAMSWHIGAWFSDTTTTGSVNRVIPGLFPIEGSSYTLNARTSAAFGDVIIPAGTAWRFTAALRAEEVRKDFDRRETVPVTGRFEGQRSDGAFLPKLTALYQVNPATSASFSIGYGRKSGGWSAYTDKPALAGFRPEDAIAYEAGIDTWIAPRTFKVAARVFDYEIRDYQIERSFNQTDYLVVNAPRARAVGGELEAEYRPRPEWTLSASVGVNQTTLREFTDPFTARNYAGNRAPYTPDYDAHVGVMYHFTSNWYAAADLIAVGRTYYDESEAYAFASPAHTTGNLQLGYETPRWRIALHCENITDVTYRALVIPGVNHAVPGAPRTYGIELSAKW